MTRNERNRALSRRPSRQHAAARRGGAPKRTKNGHSACADGVSIGPNALDRENCAT